MFYTYILYSLSKCKFYVGQTNDINDRIIRHNSGNIKSTKYGFPWKIVFYFEFDSRAEAMDLENKIKKRGASRFLESMNFDFNEWLSRHA